MLLQSVIHMKNRVLEPEDEVEAVDKAEKANGKHFFFKIKGMEHERVWGYHERT